MSDIKTIAKDKLRKRLKVKSQNEAEELRLEKQVEERTIKEMQEAGEEKFRLTDNKEVGNTSLI
jgi:hypothetical protein